MNQVLLDTAFGPSPGRTALPAPRDGHESWLRAVALGGQGRYAAARAELVRARRLARRDTDLLSLTLSTEGSFLRQLGLHSIAAEYDGAARRVGQRSTAVADALTGLAADALGVGRFGLSARLLDRARDHAAATGPRPRLRLHWVTAELAMATGAAGVALASADDAVVLAATSRSVRHQVKSALLRAAALGCLSETSAALTQARTVAATCREHGLVPLQWAAGMLCATLDSEPASAALAAAEAEDCADLVARRGGYCRGIRQSFRR